MEKLSSGALLLALILAPPLPATAGTSVQISLPAPPAIVFSVQPSLVLLPGTYVWAAPDIEEDIFFSHGWWWRPWKGQWYRSRHYDGGWTFYRQVPSFYRQVPATWRDDYRHRRWKGHHWKTERIARHELEQHWKKWKKNDRQRDRSPGDIHNRKSGQIQFREIGPHDNPAQKPGKERGGAKRFDN